MSELPPNKSSHGGESNETLRKSVDFLERIKKEDVSKKHFILPEITSKHSESKRDSLFSDKNYRSINLYLQYKMKGQRDSREGNILDKESSLRPRKSGIVKTCSLRKMDTFQNSRFVPDLSRNSRQRFTQASSDKKPLKKSLIVGKKLEINPWNKHSKGMLLQSQMQRRKKFEQSPKKKKKKVVTAKKQSLQAPYLKKKIEFKQGNQQTVNKNQAKKKKNPKENPQE